MMPKLYTERDVAFYLHRNYATLLAWLTENPTDQWGQPFFLQVGRNKRFTGDQIVRLIHALLTYDEAQRQLPTGEGVIYFIDNGAFIKIGFSRALESRIIKMKTDAPGDLKLLHTEPGTFQSEKILHRHFDSLRAHGEWFRRELELLEYIEQRQELSRGI